ncbi:hypothetical protein ACX3O0_08185 [Homoserinimonas sp. A447]
MAQQFSVLRGPFHRFFEGDLSKIPALNERQLNRLASELGVRLYDSQGDEGIMDRASVFWDFTIMRTEDGKARVLTGDLHIQSNAGAEQIREILSDLVRLAHNLKARLWHGFGADDDEYGIVTPEYIQLHAAGDPRATS